MAFVVLFDEELARTNLLPLTFTRPVCEIRFGILTVREKWEMSLDTTVSYMTQNYLASKFPLKASGEGLFINGSICPSQKLLDAVKSLRQGQALYQGSNLIAFYGTTKDAVDPEKLDKIQFNDELLEINHLWDIFQKNGAAILSDFKLITANKKTQPLSDTVTVIGDRNLVFLEAGAMAEACILNTTGGPIYLGKDAEIMEGSAVRSV